MSGGRDRNPCLAPASSWAAVRMNFQADEEQESFMLRMAARTKSGSEPSIADKEPICCPGPSGQPRTFGISPIS